MQNQKTRQITNGAMMAAMFTVLLAISVYVPILSTVTSLLLGLPIAWYSAKYHWKATALVAAVCLILSLIVGGLVALPLALIHLPIGLMIGIAIHQKKSKLFMFMGSSLVLLLSLMLQYVAMIVFLGINLLDELSTVTEESMANAIAAMEGIGASTEEFEEAANQLVFSFEVLMPSLLILVAFFLAWLLLLIYLPILKRLGTEVPKFPPFRDMKLPKSVLWYYLIVLLVTLLSDLQAGTMMYMAFMNAYVLLQVLLFLQGVSFYHFYIKQEGWPVWVTVLVTILAVPLQSFTSIVGIVDLGFDLRGWIKRAHESKGK